jgi:hypothetical protein
MASVVTSRRRIAPPDVRRLGTDPAGGERAQSFVLGAAGTPVAYEACYSALTARAG